MLVELVALPDHHYNRVAFYSAQVVGRPCSEYADFMKRMKQDPKDWRQAGILNQWISRIGTLYGAQDHFFKREGYAERLPPPTYRFVESDGELDFGLRLYCLVLSEEVVILLNGGRKTAQQLQDCPHCFPHFKFANKLSDAVYKARWEENIIIDGRDLLMEEDFFLSIPG